MVSDGGATVGYCSIGRPLSASKPPIVMHKATTQAKMGLLMKKRGPI